ncbi:MULTISPECIES: hypothetical protein [unclassified Sphingomonas]|uniref:hypothetical protein n=1 Tax=unclassified Sphingomonas TaxID=196159 RepID=UPI0006FEA8BA|nr:MULTISPECIES: hypothetical protein [unclassified Sphingomonas]KQX19327.1 hypothetical protein ASD17_12350 [Sphingomonas sp. Root1294]KQY65530.1 hypothetical protein ASD39_15550 [Sphingomonas sp. Root50]KRB95170.1 hypothetical protein ASE22_04510 [Sphingomonas sp. Root720]
MSMVDDAEAIERIVPQTRLASLIRAILPYLLAALLAGFLLWWIFLRPAQLAREGAQARADSEIQAGATKAATDALNITVDVRDKRAAIDALTRSNQDAILSAAGAGAPVDPAVYSALHDALCLRAAYQSEPDCAAMRSAGGSIGPAEADTWGPTPDDPGGR